MNLTWIKLAVDILDDAKIKIIRSHPDGNSIVVLWIGLLCLAMKSARPGIIEISDGIPYTIDDLSSAFNIEKKTVELGLALFAKYRMIDLFDGNTIEVINFAKHQSLERIEEKRALNRARVKSFRDKQRSNALLMHTTCDVTLTDKNKKENKNKNKKERENRGIFQIPTLQEISDYCMERQNGINAETFLNHYTSNGWMVGKNKMKDWKAAVRTWEQRDLESTPQAKPLQKQESPYEKCPRCGKELRKGYEYIKIGGQKCCEYCPEARVKAKQDYERLSGLVSVKSM